MSDTPRCEKCDCEIETGFQFALCPHADECALWDKTLDADTQLSMWRMWATQARTVFDDMRSALAKAEAERDEALSQRNQTIRELSAEMDRAQAAEKRAAAAAMERDAKRYIALRDGAPLDPRWRSLPQLKMRVTNRALSVVRLSTLIGIFGETLDIEVDDFIKTYEEELAAIEKESRG